jgi:hypothetical protein
MLITGMLSVALLDLITCVSMLIVGMLCVFSLSVIMLQVVALSPHPPPFFFFLTEKLLKFHPPPPILKTKKVNILTFKNKNKFSKFWKINKFKLFRIKSKKNNWKIF